MATQVDALDLFGSWRSIELFDPLSERGRGICASRPKILPGTRPFPEHSPHGDVFAVGNLPTKLLHPLPLSAEKPSKDDHVWIILPIQDLGLRVLPCRVNGFDRGWMSFVFENSGSEKLSSGLAWAELADDKDRLDVGGAPIVNLAGEVVGVTASMRWEGGQWVGQATPTTCFREYL